MLGRCELLSRCLCATTLATMKETRWWTYVLRTIGADTAQDAAEKAGFDKSAFTRWKKGAMPDAAFAVKLARAYGGNVLEALASAGIITDEEATVHEVYVGRREALRSAEPEALADEVRRRLIGGARERT